MKVFTKSSAILVTVCSFVNIYAQETNQVAIPQKSSGVMDNQEANPVAILQKSAEAFSRLKSYKADTVMESYASLTPQKGVIYQKVQPDGSTVMRLEKPATIKNAMTPVGNSNNITIPASYTLISSAGAYTITGNKAINMSGMPDMDKLKGTMSSDALRKMAQGAQTGVVNYTLASDVVDGKECWVVTIPTSAAALDAAKKAVASNPQLAALKISPSAIPLPAESVIYFDKQSYLLVKEKTLDSNNKELQSMTYQNMQTNIDIPDQMFKLPDNIQIEDYSTLIKNITPNQ